MLRLTWAATARAPIAAPGGVWRALLCGRVVSRRNLCRAANHVASCTASDQEVEGEDRGPGLVHRASENRASRDLRRVLRRVPSPVVVVTTAGTDGTLRGITCSSFTSVSLRPPVVSFCIAQPSSTADVLTGSEKCAVHVLSAKQASISHHFAQGAPKDARSQFEGISHHVDPDTGLPVLHGSLGIVFCTRRDTLLMGDHLVWFGDVSNVHEGAAGNPLLYYLRTYRSVGEEAFMRQFETTTLSFDKWTHVAHVRMAWNYIQEVGFESALPLIRDGIKRYNNANLDKISHGYNETITLFFARMISHSLGKDASEGIAGDESTFSDFLQRHPHLADKSFLFNYYTKELLFSADAKQRWIDPDLNAMPDQR